MEGARKDLAGHFARRVRTLGRIDAGGLLEGRLGVSAVDGRAASEDQPSGTGFARRFEDASRASSVDVHVRRRPLERRPHTRQCREMDDDLGPRRLEGGVHRVLIADVLLEQPRVFR